MFSEKLQASLTREVEKFLSDVKPNDFYWNGKMSWKGMVEFRNKFSLKGGDDGFRKSEQLEILKWGGINNFKSFHLMKDSIVQLKEGMLSYSVYSNISSMSKLFSFHNPKKYFILDARVALTINYFISDNKTGDFMIPFKPYRSKGEKVKVALQRFQGCAKFENLGQAYMTYNSLVLSIFKNMTIPNGLPNKPEIIEMAIFSIAERILSGDYKK